MLYWWYVVAEEDVSLYVRYEVVSAVSTWNGGGDPLLIIQRTPRPTSVQGISLEIFSNSPICPSFLVFHETRNCLAKLVPQIPSDGVYRTRVKCCLQMIWAFVVLCAWAIMAHNKVRPSYLTCFAAMDPSFHLVTILNFEIQIYLPSPRTSFYAMLYDETPK